MLSDMILDTVLQPEDIDPLHRRERIGHKRNTTPLVPILAENETVKQQLQELGFSSQTIEEVKPIHIMHAYQLSQVHTLLGKNVKLGLSGRPLLVSRTMTTASLHLLDGKEIIFLPYYFNPQGFYFSLDNKLLVEHFRSSLKFLEKQWDKTGQPVIPFLVRESMLTEKDNAAIFKLLSEVQNGECDSIIVKTGLVGELLSMVAVERIDNLNGFELKNNLGIVKEPSLTICSEEHETSALLRAEEVEDIEIQNDEKLISMLVGRESRLVKTHILGVLWQRKEADYEIAVAGGTMALAAIAEKLYESASVCQEWAVLRRIADLTGKYDDRLEDVLLDIIIRQKRLAVGRAYSEKATFSKPHESMAIMQTIVQFCGNNVAECTLTQEIILHLGHLIRTEFDLFNPILTLRTWDFIQLLVGQISREEKLSMGDAYMYLLGLAPSSIYERLRAILRSFTQEVRQLLHQENLHASMNTSLENIQTVSFNAELPEVEDWAQWRYERGMIVSFSSRFYKDVWHLLRQCNALVIGDKYNIQNRMGSELTLDSTAGEQSFALKIDAQIQCIEASDYRQLNIEAIESLARLLRQNPDLHVNDDLILDVLIGHAVRVAWEKNHYGNYDEQKAQAWESFYKLPPDQTDKAFIEAFMYLLLPQESDHKIRA